MAKKDYVIGLATGAVIAVLACMVVQRTGIRLPFEKETVLSDPVHVNKLRVLEDLVDEIYLGRKDEEQLAEGMYKGLIYGLGDEYSCYYTAEEYEQANSSSEGTYEGVGVLLTTLEPGRYVVETCYPNSPADLAGILEGDIIVSMNGTVYQDLSEMVDRIHDKELSSVTFEIERKGEEGLLSITVDIANVELPSVHAEMLEDNTGYIAITGFKAVTPGQYKEAFSTLAEEGMDRLVVDLRGNLGGYLESVCAILRDILPEGLIVYSEDKYGNREEEYCDGKHQLMFPLAVLVDGKTASASEIFAGAVQDYGIGIIVGTNTYGKGVIQSIRSFIDGSAVKLTSSHYYTPLGKDIHKVGITPDVYVESSAGSDRKSLSFEEDDQLQEAIRRLKEKERMPL